jgi:hypothetical protein
LQEKLSGQARRGAEPARWMSGFGKLRRLRRETARVQRVIDRDLDVIEPEDRQCLSIRTRSRFS